MKSNMKKMLLGVAIALTGSPVISSAQIFVAVHPRHEVVVVRPAAPSPRHVWVDEDWRPRRGRYEWSGGYWVAPPREGMVWRPGHWRDTPRGAYWVRGHWARI